MPTLRPSDLDLARIEALAQRYRLALPERQQSRRAGEAAGRRTGNSIEFQDRKDYTLGDDLRHIDWRAFARTDRLTVKLYREEISPCVDILVDLSASTGVTAAKHARTIELAWVFWLLARRLYGTVRLWALAERPHELARPERLVEMGTARCTSPMRALRQTAQRRRGGIRVLVSDLLFEHDPADLLAALEPTDRIVLLQVLTRFENDPPETGPERLEDAETGQALDLRLTPSIVATYRRRLEQLREDLATRLRSRGGAMAATDDETTLDAVLRACAAAGIVEC